MEDKALKRNINFNSRKLRSAVAGSLMAIAAILIFTICYLRLTFTQSAVKIEAGDIVAMSRPMIALVCAAFSLVLIIMLGIYIYLNEKQMLVKPKNLLIMLALVILSTTVSSLTTIASPYINAMLIAVILTSVLVKRRLAYVIVLVTAAIGGLMVYCPVFDGTAMNVMVSSSVIIAQTVGGFAAIFALNTKRGRMAPIISGLVGGLVSGGVYILVQASLITPFEEAIVPMLWLFGSGLLCGIIATGLMPVFEVAFDVATDARLNELMNNNNPLIKRLMVEAPGTYHHSMLVAALAESAAEAVEANSLLCKAAGYYHDVGKLRSPMHFKENQRDFNIHDTLEPLESAQRIVAHRKDGVTLLTKYKLPSDVIRIAAEHHGDSTVIYFYNKALQNASKNEQIDESDYMYKAPRPSSKESGILMLADCCEAAVRSIKQPSQASIEAKVHDVIDNIWLKRNGQLNESPLTASDITVIERSFIKTLSAQYHERIEYPDLEEIENAKR